MTTAAHYNTLTYELIGPDEYRELLALLPAPVAHDMEYQHEAIWHHVYDMLADGEQLEVVAEQVVKAFELAGVVQ